MHKFFALCLVGFSLVFFSCGDEENGLSVDEYIAQNNLVTSELDQGVHIIIDNPGDADRPDLDMPVLIKFVGKLTDGTVFVERDDEPLKDILSNLLGGFQIGIRALGRGGSGTMIIPSNLGYGPLALGNIPANSTLVYDVEVIDFGYHLSFSQTVDQYIAENNLETIALAEGVHIVIEEPGDSTRPNLDTPFIIKYEGKLTDGTVFDSNSDGFSSTLRNLIGGWQIGIPEFGIGGKGTLIIPPAQGYGSQSTGSIPPNSTLIFDVEILDYQ